MVYGKSGVLVGFKQVFTCSNSILWMRLNISCVCKQLNLDRLLAKMWEAMGLVRVYTKPQGQQPDFSDPVVLSAVC